MSIEFEINKKIKTRYDGLKNNNRPYIVEFILKYFKSIIKTEKQAERVIISISIFVFLLCLFIIFNTIQIVNPKTTSSYKIYQEDLSPEFRKTLSPEVLETIPYKYEK